QIRTSKNFNVATNGIGVSELYNFANSSSGLFTAANGILEQRRIGGYADVTGGFRNFIYLHGVLRRDYTSVFSGPKINFNDPSFVTYGGDVSFIATDVIPGLKNSVIESIKLRAGYNRNGNDNLSAYSLQTIYPNATGFPYSGLLGTTVGNTVVSPDLKPEIVKTGELGIEISLLKNRVSLEGSIYKQSAEQQILNVSVSSAIGYSSYLINAADVTNKGYELDLKVIPFKNKNWNILVSGNYSYNTNVVNTLYGGTGLKSLEYQSPDELASLNAEVGQTFPYLKTTIFQRDDQGRIIVDPTDGWPLRGSQRAGQGSTLPKNILGLGFVASYKNFTLVANAEYRGGFVVYHDLGNDMSFTGTGINTALYGRDQFVWPNSVYLDAAGKSVPNTNIAVDNYKAIYQGFGDVNFSRGFAGVGEVYVSSGDFWKLRDVSFAYEFPSSLFRRGSVLHGVNVSVWGRNLVTLLPADNVYTDPEFSNTSGNAQGINNTLNTPPTRQLGGTVKFIF
ncbi:MAG TPA: hypothetical protein VHK91_13650, partial [Flavisolibacter sp.]|nr:hypothetical protein [Flavisolibacter sp.]